MRAALTLLVLYVTWLLWSGMFKPLLLAFGAVSCLLVLYLAYRMRFFAQEMHLLHLLRGLPLYLAWLLKEIVKSNLEVARIVLRRHPPISPTVVELAAEPASPMGQALLANSITLTPGTVTIDVDGGRMKVHCLTRAGAESLLEGEMGRRVAAVTER